LVPAAVVGGSLGEATRRRRRGRRRRRRRLVREEA